MQEATTCSGVSIAPQSRRTSPRNFPARLPPQTLDLNPTKPVTWELSESDFWIDQLASEAVVVGFGGREAQHHDCVACCAHQVIAFFDNLAILAVIEAKL